MKAFDRRALVRFAAILGLSVLFLLLGRAVLVPKDAVFFEASVEYCPARIVFVGDEIRDEVTDQAGKTYVTGIRVPFTAVILSGTRKGETVDGFYYADLSLPDERYPKAGDRAVLSPAVEGDAIEGTWLFVSYDRTVVASALFGVFFLLILLLGGKKGARTILSLVLTALAVFAVYIPALLGGRNVYLLTALVSLYVIVMSLLLIDGASKKTLCAIIGNTGGALLAALLAYLLSLAFHLNGAPDQSFLYLNFVRDGVIYDLRGIVWSGMVIGSLGAVMDVAMTIASAMHELADNMREPTRAHLIRSGMNIGRDAIGTMTNTLILAYIGCELGAVMLLVSYNVSMLNLLNMEMIITEILRALAGSLGILLAVPVTVLAAAFIYTAKRPAETEFHIGHDLDI